jgi:high-affinity K+ transport system ATPase subunit B
MVAAVAAAAAVTSPSPAAAAAAGGDQTTQLLLPSIHKIMEEDKLKELNGGKTPPLADTPPLDVADIGVASTAAAKKLGPLVDYDSDSDEESSTSEEESSSTSSALPPAKRLKTASGGAPAV